MSIRSNVGRNGTETSGPRWWRWRRHVAETAPTAADDSWSERLDRMCQQVAPYLPPLSANTRKAIICMVALVVAWKFVIWTLELVVTGACFALAVAILLCFLRPDVALRLVTQVVPPYVDDVRCWLSHSFMRASQLLDRPPGTSSLPLPLPHPTHRSLRSPRTTLTALPETALMVQTHA